MVASWQAVLLQAGNEPLPEPLLGRRCIPLLLAVSGVALLVGKASAQAGDPAASDSLVVDDGSRLSAPTEADLSQLLRKLERDADVKLRVICPPPGLQQDAEQWRSYLRPISKRFGLDQGSIVIVADEPEKTRRATSGPKQLGWLSITAGSKLQEKFQYTFTNDYTLRTASAFGSSEYVNSRGIDMAVREATENVVAALYDLLDRRATSLPRVVRGFREPLSSEEVAAILKRHAT